MYAHLYSWTSYWSDSNDQQKQWLFHYGKFVIFFTNLKMILKNLAVLKSFDKECTAFYKSLFFRYFLAGSSMYKVRIVPTIMEPKKWIGMAHRGNQGTTWDK